MNNSSEFWVSILTPVKNGIEFLRHCAMSVFNQKEEGWEWIIGINGHGAGGSALAEAEEVAAIAARHVPGGIVRVVNLPKAGSKVAALNQLVGLATAPWVAVLDVDDSWEPQKLAAQRNALAGAAKGADVIGTRCMYFGDMICEGPALPTGWIQQEDVWRSNPIINSSALIRKELAIWLEDSFGVEDYDLWLRLTRAGYRMYNIDAMLVHHRIHRGSAFNGKGKQDVAGLLEHHLNAHFSL